MICEIYWEQTWKDLVMSWAWKLLIGFTSSFPSLLTSCSQIQSSEHSSFSSFLDLAINLFNRLYVLTGITPVEGQTITVVFPEGSTKMALGQRCPQTGRKRWKRWYNLGKNGKTWFKFASNCHSLDDFHAPSESLNLYQAHIKIFPPVPSCTRTLVPYKTFKGPTVRSKSIYSGDMSKTRLE